MHLPTIDLRGQDSGVQFLADHVRRVRREWHSAGHRFCWAHRSIARVDLSTSSNYAFYSIMADDVEIRTLDGLRAEQTDGATPRLTGHAIRVNTPSLDLGGFVEVVTPEAVATALRRAPDLRMLAHHDPARVLGRVSAKTLAVTQDTDGLRFEVEPPAHEAGLVESVRRG